MPSYRLPAFVAAAFVLACGAATGKDVAATAGGHKLSVTRLGDILGSSQAPLDKEVARSIAELWVNYQLVGLAGAEGDSLAEPKVMDDALWSTLDNMRVRKFYEQISKGWDSLAPGTDEERYNRGEAMAARHILVSVDSSATPEQRAVALKKAQGIRAQATPANFAKLAARSDEPGAAERGGDLGLFMRGQMVPEFERAVLALKPGEISEPVQTQFGYHVIYRSPYADVATQFAPMARQRNVAIAESTYLARMEEAAGIKVEADAATKAKNIARNPLGYAGDKAKLATYKGGTLTASRFADWVAAYPPQAQIRPQLLQAADTLVERFVRQIVRNELVTRQADSAKAAVDSAEKANLYLQFRNNLTQTWTQLGVDPSKLADSAKAAGKGDRKQIAAARIEAFFDRLVKNEVPFVDVAYPVARALQQKYKYGVNEAGLDGVLERAKSVRASLDSLKSEQPSAAPATPSAPPAVPPAAPPAK